MPRNAKSLLHATAADIRNLRPGTYNDDDLLDLTEHFADDDERLLATWEAVLRSPEHKSLIDYKDVYAEVVSAWLSRQDEATARRWAYAWLAYTLQQAFIRHRQEKAPQDAAPSRRSSGIARRRLRRTPPRKRMMPSKLSFTAWSKPI